MYPTTHRLFLTHTLCLVPMYLPHSRKLTNQAFRVMHQPHFLHDLATYFSRKKQTSFYTSTLIYKVDDHSHNPVRITGIHGINTYVSYHQHPHLNSTSKRIISHSLTAYNIFKDGSRPIDNAHNSPYISKIE